MPKDVFGYEPLPQVVALSKEEQDDLGIMDYRIWELARWMDNDEMTRIVPAYLFDKFNFSGRLNSDEARKILSPEPFYEWQKENLLYQWNWGKLKRDPNRCEKEVRLAIKLILRKGWERIWCIYQVEKGQHRARMDRLDRIIEEHPKFLVLADILDETQRGMREQSKTIRRLEEDIEELKRAKLEQ